MGSRGLAHQQSGAAGRARCASCRQRAIALVDLSREDCVSMVDVLFVYVPGVCRWWDAVITHSSRGSSSAVSIGLGQSER